MRARNLKPGFFKNEDLAALEPLARLLFAGLWCMADRAGRLEHRPKRIKAEVLPYDNCNIIKLITQLRDKKFIACYSVNGSDYIEIINFGKHQNCHIKEAASTIPAPDKHGAIAGNSGDDPAESFNPLSSFLNPESPLLNPESREEGQNTLRSRDRTPASKMSDEEWMNSLRKNPAYEGLDFDGLYGKMLAWCDANGRKPTRRRFVNWLNREDKPIRSPLQGKKPYSKNSAAAMQMIEKLRQENHDAQS